MTLNTDCDGNIDRILECDGNIDCKLNKHSHRVKFVL